MNAPEVYVQRFADTLTGLLVGRVVKHSFVPTSMLIQGWGYNMYTHIHTDHPLYYTKEGGVGMELLKV